MPNYKPATLCEMKTVESSQISRVGYVPANSMIGYLFVDFSRDPSKKSLYLYHPISASMYENMMTAESKGSYFNANIKNNPAVTCIKVPD